jgi:tripartite-type tricarboxylate transporter receptor subunit TctC
VPEEIVQKLAAEVARIQALPDVRARLAELGAEPVVEGPAPLAARVNADIARWAEVVKAANVTAE